MVKRKLNILRKNKKKRISFSYGEKTIQIIVDKFLIFNFFKKLHNRFWGIAAIIGLCIGLAVCFIIEPDLLVVSTAFSDFSKSVNTAPYFAGACFFAAYALWRWRNYLNRTVKRPQPISTFLSLTVIALYIVALTPLSLKPWPYIIHIFGVTLLSLSLALTVIFDLLLTKTRRNQNANSIRLVKLFSFFLIVIGVWLSLGSLEFIHWYNVMLLGESTMLLGYAIWIIIKTYQGEEPRSRLNRLISKFVVING
jgi:hypothetical protein